MGKHGSYPRVDGDHYPTPGWAVTALAEHIELSGLTIWEAATGAGLMAEALKTAGASVFCSDIADRGYPLDAIIDFTNGACPAIRFDGTVTNPAYGYRGKTAEHFIEAGLRHITGNGGGFLALLLSADFDSAKTRPRFFRDCPLFAAKIVLTRRLVWFSNPDLKKENPKENHAWFIWRFPPPASAPLILYAPRNTSSPIPETATAGCPFPTPATSLPEKALPMSKPTLRDVNADNQEPEPESKLSISKPDEKFNLDRFKSKRTAKMANVGVLPTQLEFHRISDANDFVRLHPDKENYWSVELCFVHVPIAGVKKDNLHLIDDDLAAEYLQPRKIIRCRVALATKPYDVFFLAQVPSTNLDNSWNESNLRGCNEGTERWVLLESRKAEGYENYKITYAKNEDAFPLPKWPKQSLDELISIKFTGRFIDNKNSPGLLRLIGAKQEIS